MTLRAEGEVTYTFYTALRTNEAKQTKKPHNMQCTYICYPSPECIWSPSLRSPTVHPQALSFCIQSDRCPATAKLHQTSPSPDVLHILLMLPIPKTTKQCQKYSFHAMDVRQRKKYIYQHAGLEGEKHHGIQAFSPSYIYETDIDS